MPGNIATMTWGDFIAGLERAGVFVQTLDDGPDGNPGKYLLRDDGNGRLRWAHLPKQFSDEALVGPQVFDRTCRRLGVDSHTHFHGWFYVL